MASLAHLQEELDPEEVKRLHDEGAIELIDVREAHEHEAGRIDGTRHVPVSGLTEAAPGLDRERPLVFYCRSGGRSAIATQAFRASGYDAHNLTGGMLAWVEKGLPIVPEGGTVADH